MSSKHSKYEYQASHSQRREETLKATKDRIKKIKDYKPTELKVKEKKYNNKLPARPNMPKLPKLSGLKSKVIDNPSGLKGGIKKYKPMKLNVAKVYKNLPGKKSKPKSSSSFNLPATKVGSLGVPSTKKAPGVTIKKSEKK